MVWIEDPLVKNKAGLLSKLLGATLARMATSLSPPFSGNHALRCEAQRYAMIKREEPALKLLASLLISNMQRDFSPKAETSDIHQGVQKRFFNKVLLKRRKLIMIHIKRK